MDFKIIKIVFVILLFSSIFFYCSGNNTNNNSSHARPIGGYNVYMGHIHNHTNFSGGTGTPYDAYLYARDTAGMDFIGITDHAEYLDSAEWSTLSEAADEFNKDNEFVTFRGFEWSSSSNYGHVSVLDTTDFRSSNDPSADTFDELCSWIINENGIAFFNHPGREDANGLEFNHFASAPVEQFAGMELWNKSSDFTVYYYNDGYNSPDGNRGFYDEALQNGWHAGASGSGDDHAATWGTAQPYRMAVLAAAKTRPEIFAAFRNRRFYSTLDSNLSLSFKINYKEMGSRIGPGTYRMEILADDSSAGEKFTSVILKKNGITVNTWSPYKENISIALDIAASANEYYYVIVKQSDGDEAISSPIWIE